MRTSFNCSLRTREQLDELAELFGEPKSQVISRAIAVIYEEYKKDKNDE